LAVNRPLQPEEATSLRLKQGKFAPQLSCQTMLRVRERFTMASHCEKKEDHVTCQTPPYSSGQIKNLPDMSNGQLQGKICRDIVHLLESFPAFVRTEAYPEKSRRFRTALG